MLRLVLITSILYLFGEELIEGVDEEIHCVKIVELGSNLVACCLTESRIYTWL